MSVIKQYAALDRTGWGSGPWDDEPDKEQGVDDATGLPYLIVRHAHGGHLCGYVGIGEDHPLYGKDYAEPEGLEVHGGLTFASRCHDDEDEETSICHIPQPGESDNVWWFGFDCGHAWDRAPGLEASLASLGHERTEWYGETYKSFEYVRGECAALAAQLQARA